MKAVVSSCLFVISLDHLDYQIVMYGSLIRNQDKFTVRFMEMDVHPPIFRGSCSNFELMQFFLDHLDCSLAVIYNKIIISGSKFLSPSMKAVVRTCTCAISLDHLDFRMFMFGSHSRNQDEFTVGFFSKPKFIFLFCKEAVRIVRLWNSLDYLDCSLVVFYIIFFISGSKSLSPSMKAVVRTCACAILLGHLDFRVFMFGSHSWTQDEYTVSFISRRKFIFLFFNEAV